MRFETLLAHSWHELGPRDVHGFSTAANHGRTLSNGYSKRFLGAGPVLAARGLALLRRPRILSRHADWVAYGS